MTAEQYEAQLCEGNEMTSAELEADGLESQWFANKANFAAWVYHDHYSDSMTGPYTSPIYYGTEAVPFVRAEGAEPGFYMEAM